MSSSLFPLKGEQLCSIDQILLKRAITVQSPDILELARRAEHTIDPPASSKISVLKGNTGNLTGEL